MRVLFLLVLLTGLLGACASPPPVSIQELEPAAEGQPEFGQPPSFVRDSGDEWVRLTSGEWLRGEFTSLVRGTLEFESEELDDLRLDWDDVAAVFTKRSFTLLLEDKSTLTGAISMDGELVTVRTNEGLRVVHRRDVQRIVKGALRERDHWSANLFWGVTLRRGNTEQTDTSLGLTTTRRTATTRFYTDLDVVESSQSGSETANNQRLVSQLDYYVTSRLYLTPLAAEAYRDRFQNVALRLSPYAGVGYTLFDSGQIEWDGLLGLGYRYTRYDTVTTDQDATQESGVGVIGSSLDADVTEKLEIDGSFQAQLGLDDLEDTNQNLSLSISYDIWGDLDLDLRFTWNRVGKPVPDEDGITPERDDLRIEFGLSWEL